MGSQTLSLFGPLMILFLNLVPAISFGNTIPSELINHESTFDSFQEGWTPQSQRISVQAVTEDGEAILRITQPALQPETNLWKVYKTFEAPANKKYFWSGKVRLDPGTWVRLELENPRNPAGLNVSPHIYPSDAEEWQDIGLPFTTTEDTEIKFNFETAADARGGSVDLKAFKLYELRDYGTFVRVKLKKPFPHDVRIDLCAWFSSLGSTVEHIPGVFTIPAFSTDWTMKWLDLANVNSAPTSSGGTPRNLSGHNPFTGIFYFMEPGHKLHCFRPYDQNFSDPELMGIEAEFQIAFDSDEDLVYFHQVKNVKNGHIGLRLPETKHSPKGLAQIPGFLGDIVTMDWDRFQSAGLRPALQPKKYWILNEFDYHPRSIDSLAAVRKNLELLRDLGTNAVTFQSQGLTESHGRLLRTFGPSGMGRSMYAWRWWRSELPLNVPGNPSKGKKYDLVEIGKQLENAATVFGSPHLSVAFGGNGLDMAKLCSNDPNQCVLDIDDDFAGIQFAGEQYKQAFHSFILGKGLKPDFFDKESFEEIEAVPVKLSFMGEMAAPNQPKLIAVRPDTDDLYATRLWYLQSVFWSKASANTFKAFRDVAETKSSWSGSYPVAANFGSPWSFGDHTFARGNELFTFAKAGAVSMIWMEDSLNWFGRRHNGNQLVGLAADYASAAAREGELGLGAHIMMGTMDRKLLSWIARGATHLFYWTYGPCSLTDQDCFGGLKNSAQHFAEVAHGNDLIAKNEDILFEGVKRRARIAMLASQTDPLWRQTEDNAYANATTKNDHGVYFALTHGHYPVDFISEEEIANGGLSGYRLLYVDVDYIRDDAFDAIRAWVNAGGVLHMGMGGLLRNEYGQEKPDRKRWLKVDFGRIQLADDTPITVNWKSKTITWNKEWRSVTLSGQAIVGTEEKVLATHRGTPIAIELKRGTGRVRIIGFPIGESYFQGIFRLRGTFQTRYQESVRSFLVDLPEQLRITRPVWTDNPYVEAHRVDTGKGTAIILLNYTNDVVDDLQVMVPGLEGTIKSSVSGQAYRLTNTQNYAIVKIGPLVTSDILRWTRVQKLDLFCLLQGK